MVQLSYRRHRFPADIIQHAIWLYLRFTLSYRDVEELLAERGLDVSVAQGKAETKPDRVLNDLGWKAMAAIRKLNHGSW